MTVTIDKRAMVAQTHNQPRPFCREGAARTKLVCVIRVSLVPNNPYEYIHDAIEAAMGSTLHLTASASGHAPCPRLCTSHTMA